MMQTGKSEGENQGGQGRPHGFDQTLEGISAESDFLCQRGHGQQQEIDEKNPKLARNQPKGDDQSAGEHQGQNARNQHAPAQGGAQAKFPLPAGTENQAHVANGLALAVQCASHRAVADDQQKEQNAAFDELAPDSARQAVGRVNRNDLGKVKVDCCEDDVAERAYSIDGGEIGQAHAPRINRLTEPWGQNAVGIGVSGVFVETGNLPELSQTASDAFLDRHGLQFT